MFTQSFLTILQACAAVLMLFTVLCCVANLLLPVMRKDLERPSPLSHTAAAIYMVTVSWFLFEGISMAKDKGNLLILLGGMAILAVGTHLIKNKGTSSEAS